MVSYKTYVAGWLYGSIHDILMAFPSTPKGMTYALITSLDSNVTPGSILKSSSSLAPLRPTAKAIGDAMLVATKDLIQAERQCPIFFGFDEVWFFPSDEIEQKPDSSWIVGPSRIDNATLNQIGGWMERNDCSCGLGDGEGVNFVVKARGMTKYMLSYSMEQPVPGDDAGIVASPQ